MKNLIKSYKFWTALSGAVGLLVVCVAKIFGFCISSAPIEEAIMAVCGVLVVFGIVKKPKSQGETTKTSDENSTFSENDATTDLTEKSNTTANKSK